jgi:hypothetical protein
VSAAINPEPALKKLTQSIQVDRMTTGNLQTVRKDNARAEEFAKLQASIPFGFLFLNRH